MKTLEQMDSKDRIDGTPKLWRLMKAPPENGTSAGYSALWISRACEMPGRNLKTIEILPNKAQLAIETFMITRVESMITLFKGDVRDLLLLFNNIAFCFLDARKELYAECYEVIIPKLVKGGVLIADNVTNFQKMLHPMLYRALSDDRVDAMITPIGTGELLCR